MFKKKLTKLNMKSLRRRFLKISKAYTARLIKGLQRLKKRMRGYTKQLSYLKPSQ